MEGHGHGFFGAYDRIKQALMMQTDRPTALRQAITRVPQRWDGVRAGRVRRVHRQGSVRVDREHGLTIKSGQTHVQRYLKPLLEIIEQGRIDPSFIISHHLPLEDAPDGYRMFRDKQDECMKIVLKPGMKKQEPPVLRPEGSVH